MSRLIISFTTFLIVMFSCIYSSVYVSNIVNPLIEEITIVKSNIANDTNINSAIMENIISKWQKSNDILGMIIRHNELDDLDASFIRTLEYAKNGNEESFTVESEELIYRLENLIEKESFSLRNLF